MSTEPTEPQLIGHLGGRAIYADPSLIEDLAGDRPWSEISAAAPAGTGSPTPEPDNRPASMLRRVDFDTGPEEVDTGKGSAAGEWQRPQAGEIASLRAELARVQGIRDDFRHELFLVWRALVQAVGGDGPDDQQPPALELVRRLAAELSQVQRERDEARHDLAEAIGVERRWAAQTADALGQSWAEESLGLRAQRDEARSALAALRAEVDAFEKSRKIHQRAVEVAEQKLGEALGYDVTGRYPGMPQLVMQVADMRLELLHLRALVTDQSPAAPTEQPEQRRICSADGNEACPHHTPDCQPGCAILPGLQSPAAPPEVMKVARAANVAHSPDYREDHP